MMNRKHGKGLEMYLLILLMLIMPLSQAYAGIKASASKKAKIETLRVTAYCACGKCCNWKRNILGQKVYASGSKKGQRKVIGITASGTKAKKGTIAADTGVFPMGTIMNIKGYGMGKVEDREGGVQGNHIDIFMKSHKQAIKWGSQTIKVKVWLAK